MRQSSPAQLFYQACQLAKANRLFIVEKPGRYLIYRQLDHKNLYLAEAKSEANLLARIKRLAPSATSRSAA